MENSKIQKMEIQKLNDFVNSTEMVTTVKLYGLAMNATVALEKVKYGVEVRRGKFKKTYQFCSYSVLKQFVASYMYYAICLDFEKFFEEKKAYECNVNLQDYEDEENFSDFFGEEEIE